MNIPSLLAQNDWNFIWVIVTVFVVVILLVIFAVLFQFLGLYVRALVSGARVSLLDLIGMRL